MKALVIGAGIHGITIACELAKLGIDVTVVDSSNEILLGTSNGTHNRVNMGYHYPRSLETVQECYQGFEYFQRHLPSALFYPKSCYYVIDSHNSHVNADQYRHFLNNAGLKYTCEYPDSDILIAGSVEESFKVLEPCYDVQMLRRLYHQKIENLSVKLVLGFLIKSGMIDDKKVTLTSHIGHILSDKFDIIVNATYAASNNIQKILGCSEIRKTYRFQKTEVVVVSCEKILPAITVMDGPFITVLPYLQGGHRNKYVVYDVVNSIHDEAVDEFLPDKFKTHHYFSKYDKMVEKGKTYFPFMEKLSAVTSLWALRPIPLSTTETDSRVTNLVKHDNHTCFYSVLEGKFVSAPQQAKIVADLLVNKA